MSNNQKVPYTRIGNYRRKGFLALTAALALLANHAFVIPATAADLTLASSASAGGTITVNTPDSYTIAVGSSATRTLTDAITLGGGTLKGGVMDNVATVSGLSGAGTSSTFVDANGVTITLKGSGTANTTANITLASGVTVTGANQLLVGGGAGGGGGRASRKDGGGGGGGFVVLTTGNLSGTLALTAGGGSAGAFSGGGATASGGTSSIGANSASGGGGAASSSGTPTGKGGDSSQTIGGITTPFTGAASTQNETGGGGAGSSANGVANVGAVGGAGGAGTQITTGVVGLSGYLGSDRFGGGGGGGANSGGGAGGGGGGGAGASGGAGVAGTDSLGGGGGGGANGTTGTGGAGGAGSVAIQYAYDSNVAAGTLTLSGGITLNSASTLDAVRSGGLIDVTTAITGAGGVNITSSASSGGVVQFSVANTYTGTTTINSGGKLVLGSALALQNSAYDTASVNGGLDVTGFTTPTLGGLTGSANLTATLITGYGSISTLTLNPQTGITSTYSGDVGNGNGSMALTKTGSGTQVLSGANTYTGATTINAGTLTLASAGSIATSTSVTIGAAGSLDTSAQATYTIPGAQPLAFVIDAAGSGSSGKIVADGLDISSAVVTYNITGTPDDPVYVLATYTSLTGAFASVPAPPTGYFLNRAYEGNKIALVASFIWNGLNGNRIWSTAGNWAGGVAPVSANTTHVVISGNTGVGAMYAGASYTIKSLTFSDSNTADANLSLSATGNPGSGSRNLTFSADSGNATLTVESGSTGNKTISRNSTAAATITLTSSLDVIHNGSGTLTLGLAANTSISGAGGINKSGTGTLSLPGANTFTGGVTINAGTVTLGNVGALNSTAGSENAVAFGSGSTGVLSLNGNSVVIKSLDSNATPGTPVVQNANASAKTLTVGNSANVSCTFAGVIQDGTGGGALALTKAGTGTLTLSGANTYSGATAINAGTLLVNGSHSAASAYTVEIGATLGGEGTITAAATVNGIVSPGSTAGSIGQLNVAGNVTWNGASGTPVATRDWLFQLGANNASDVLNITGDFNKGSGGIFRFNFGGTTSLGTFVLVDWSGSTTFSASDFSYDASSLGANQDVVFLFNGSRLEVVLTAGCVNPPNITLGANPTVCRGTTSTTISYSNAQNTPDQYYIDYSDTANTSGGFVDVGVTTLAGLSIPLSVPVAAPVGTYNGTLYVINSTIGCRSLGIPFTVTVTDTPSTPGTISGSASVCQNTSDLTYSIAAVDRATTYTWAVPGNATLVSGQGTTSITVNWGAAGSGSITVNAQNSCGTSANQSLTVTVLAGVPVAPVANAARVITATSFLASWSSVSGAAGYRLDVATTEDFQSGTFVVGFENQSVAGTSTTVGSLTTGVTYYYRVRASNACGTGINSDVNTAVPSPLLVAWDMSGLSNYGSSPEAATVANADVTAGGLTRGSGLSGGTSAVRGWGGTNWANLEADAVSGSKFATFTVKGNANRNVSITSISTFDYRLDSANGPVSGKLQYALDGVTFTDVPDAAFTYDVSASGGSIPPIELSGVAELQNVPDTVTVTFRILNYGASSSSESWYIYDKNNLTDYDFEVRGLICNSPTTYALNGGGTFCSASFSDTTLSLAGSESGVTYQLYTNNQLNAVGSPVAGTGSAISFGSHSATGTYTVLATRDSGGCSKVVGTTTITVLTTPGAPTSLVAPLNGIQVELNWHAPAGTKTGYKVYRRTSSGSYGTAITTINSGATTNYVDSPAGGETYYYQVTALNGSCEGTASSEAGPVVVPNLCPNGIRPTLSTQGLTALAASVRVNIAPSLDISIIAADSTGCTPPTFEMNGISGATPGVTITDTPNSPAAGSRTRRIQWTPGVNEVGTYPVSFTATDSQGLATSITFVIHVGQQSDTLPGGVPSSQTNWNIPIVDIRVPSSGNATVEWTSVDGIVYDVYSSTAPIGGGASWTKIVSGHEAAGSSTYTDVVASGSARYYNVVPSGQAANNRGVWGVVRPSVPSSTITYMAPPVPETASDLDFSGNLGDALAAALTDPDDRIYVMSPGSNPGWTTLRLAGEVWIIDGGGAYTTPLNPGQGFLIVRDSGSASPTFSGPVGNLGTEQISLAVGYNIIGISEGKGMPVVSAFENASPVGNYDDEQADQIILLNSDGSFRRLWRLGNGTWYDTETRGATSLILQPGQAYYYIRRTSGTTLSF